jgi:rod shape determining protein RodA
MINNQRSFFFNVDWVTVFIFLALCTIGWFNIHAAVFDERYPSIIDAHTNYGKQFTYIVVAIIVGGIILLLESRFITALAPAFYMATLLLLVIVLVVGVDKYWRWFQAATLGICKVFHLFITGTLFKRAQHPRG